MKGRIRSVLGVLVSDNAAHPLQTLTTLLGVAVGIAVIVAIRLASDAALNQFRGTYDSMAGVATHQLTRVGRLDPARLLALRAHPSVDAVQPVVAATVLIPPAVEPPPGDQPLVVVEGQAEAPRSLRLVGVDPFQAAPFLQLSPEALEASGDSELFTRLLLEPGLVALGRETGEAWGLAEGDALELQIPGGRRTATVTLIEEPRLSQDNPPFALADLATAQELLGLNDEVLRFDLVLSDEGADIELFPGERLEPAASRGERADTLTEAFRTNLACLGMLAVLVGAFVVFSMAQFAVTRRRALMGRLRCMGCPARVLLVSLLGEASVLGLIGGLLGLLGGGLLARLLVGDVARSVGTLYGPVGGLPIPELDLITTFLALGTAVAASVGATAVPALSAARTPPIAVAGQAPEDAPPPLWLPLGLLLLAGGLLIPTGSAVILPSLAVLAVLLATATLMPSLLGRLVRKLTDPPLIGLASARISRSLGRTGAAAGALAMPLAMTIAVIVMVGSFRSEVVTWSNAVLSADIYAKPLWFELAPERAQLPEGLVEDMQSRPGVLAVDTLRMLEQPSPEGSFMVAGAALEMIERRESLRVLEGPSLPEIVASLRSGRVMITEPLARKRNLGPGDTLVLLGREGPVELPVVAIFQDFSLDRGYALLDVDAFGSLYGKTPVRNAALLLDPETDAEALALELSKTYPGAVFRTVSRLREDVVTAFDDTFAITYLLQAISTTLALLGVLTALLCLHLERRQEMGVLRALGARLSTVGGLMLVEATMITGLAGAVSLPVGLGLSWILVRIVNTRSFGWSFPMNVDAPGLLGVLALALLAGLAAACVPWLMVRRSEVARLLEPRR
ncbi:MAG: ABC transporter permease [Planctomycetota bacterium]|nr:ABC transporter permease [Planctomycetota bacterium]